MFGKAIKYTMNNKKKSALAVGLLAFIVFFIFCLPTTLFNKPTCSVLLDRTGKLLSAQIAQDEQWRFPHNDTVPEKFKIALVTFEDHNYYDHIGVSLRSLVRAIKQNINQGKIVSGASTITMQVIRMSRDNPDRTIFEKITEMIRAIRLETRYSKEEILAYYASNAPMGGNVVGLDAAAWRYFGRDATELSWAEAATLAVLPNAPSLIYPGKNQKKLLDKRNRLLHKLNENGVIDHFTLDLSLMETLPKKPHRLPQISPQLTALMSKKNGKGKLVHTTLDKNLQLQAMAIIQQHYNQLKQNHIYNAATVILDVKSKEVLAYVANTYDPENQHHNQVDIIQAPRSTGSILKPFLYSMMLNDGELLPHQLVKDVPAHFVDYQPKNYSNSNEGAVSADRALSKSLNVPAVFMLKNYGVQKFHHQLQRMNFKHLTRPSIKYGLSLILGGAEASLWEISNAYASMSYDLYNYTQLDGNYYANSYRNATFVKDEKKEVPVVSNTSIVSASSLYFTFEAMLKVNRPDNELGWENFSSSRKIAWKTGTSFGFRDAWAVGVTPDYVIGVWVGNADGEGRPGVVGVKAAAPILFDLFDLTPSQSWFITPYDDMQKTNICAQSGFRAGEFCDQQKEEYIPEVTSKAGACPYHRPVHINKHGQRVNRSCEKAENIQTINWFVLPPLQAWYYKKVHPEYKPLPPYSVACMGKEKNTAIDLIFPKPNAKIYIPRGLDGKMNKLIFKAAYRNVDRELYWHLNNKFLGTTSSIHHMELQPKPGKYTLTLMDELGNYITRKFEVLEKEGS